MARVSVPEEERNGLELTGTPGSEIQINTFLPCPGTATSTTQGEHRAAGHRARCMLGDPHRVQSPDTRNIEDPACSPLGAAQKRTQVKAGALRETISFSCGPFLLHKKCQCVILSLLRRAYSTSVGLTSRSSGSSQGIVMNRGTGSHHCLGEEGDLGTGRF